MKKTCFVLLSILCLMTSCSNKNDTNNSYGNANLNQDFDFVYDLPANSFGYSLEGKVHLKAAEDIINLAADITEVYEFDVNGTSGEYYQYRDKLGEYYLGENYDSAGWRVNESTSLDGFMSMVAVYSPEVENEEDEYKGLLQVDNTGLFMYQPEGRESFDLERMFKNGKLIRDDSTEYLLTDKSKITYADAVKAADKLMKGFDLAEGRDTSPVSEVRYSAENKTIKVDYLQKVHGLKISKLRDRMDINDTADDALGVHTSNTFPTKEAYVFASGEDGAFVYVFAGDFEAVNETKHEKIITLQSALDFIDENLAANLHCEIRSMELRYLLTADEVEQDNGSIKLETHGVPVWEIILYDSASNQEYACVMNVLTGEFSFVRLVS